VITSLQIKNFKGIKSTHKVDLSPFHVLVGPNASGKSTFLDAIEFVKTCLRDGPRKAVEQRVPDFRDLTFMRRGGQIEFDIWLNLSSVLSDDKGAALHYRLAIISDEELGVRVSEESLTREDRPKSVRLVAKTATGKDSYRRESGTYQDVFVFGLDKLALSLTPPDKNRYPTGNAVKDFLMNGVRYIQLNSAAMRLPAPATRATELDLDGTNLARVVSRLARSKNGEGVGALNAWTEHLRYAIEDLQSIGWAAREPDNAEYVLLRYTNGLECPSWLLSDGTLRMLALTLPAFLPAEPRIYMVEEPENGVHPKALEIIIKALGAIPQAQVFVATHSPLVVQQSGLDPLLCFSRDQSGVHVVRGSKHHLLTNWRGVPDLASIFASRVLG
jgi:predicted ATPase